MASRNVWYVGIILTLTTILSLTVWAESIERDNYYARYVWKHMEVTNLEIWKYGKSGKYEFYRGIATLKQNSTDGGFVRCQLSMYDEDVETIRSMLNVSRWIDVVYDSTQGSDCTFDYVGGRGLFIFTILFTCLFFTIILRLISDSHKNVSCFDRHRFEKINRVERIEENI